MGSVILSPIKHALNSFLQQQKSYIYTYCEFTSKNTVDR